MNKNNTKKYNKRLMKNHNIIFKLDKIILAKPLVKFSKTVHVVSKLDTIENPIFEDDYVFNKDKTISIDLVKGMVVIIRGRICIEYIIKTFNYYKENNLRILEIILKEQNNIYKI